MVATLYPWIKALHIISVIAWMAGLFYLPRLYVYHAEQVEKGSKTDEMFQTMERRLIRAIMNPGMIATWAFGLWLAIVPGVIDWTAIWPYAKAVSILGMTWFHHWCSVTRKGILAGEPMKPGRHYRIMNEVPTLLLIVIVISVVVRPF